MDKNLKKPRITVLMACYNSEKYLKEAIDSILNQTFSDFELIIINDGSTDKSAEFITSYKDSRIFFLQNKENMGHTHSLNLGLKIAKGEYVARMDSDDISLPSRLEEQIKFMDSHPNIAACGSWTKTIGKISGYVNKYFTESEDIRANLLFYTSLAHPSVIIRKSSLKKHNLEYNIDIDRDENSEDYALWVKLSQLEKLANIPKVLLLFRTHSTNVTKIFKEKNNRSASLIRKRQLEKLNIFPTDGEMVIHDTASLPNGNNIEEFITAQEVWLQKIKGANEKLGIYNTKSLNKVLFNRWYSICLSNTRHGLYIWKRYKISSLTKLGTSSKIKNHLKILIKSLYKPIFH